jgi:hypothetical protein
MSANGQTGESKGWSAEEKALTETALDYGQGWYAGDGDRMERSLHPDLGKRALMARPVGQSGKYRQFISHMSAMTLVQATRGGSGKKVPEATRRTDVKILDVYGNAACVRLDMHDWIDYLHMSKLNGRWVIVNVLWELTPNAKKEAGFPDGM